MNAWKRGAPLAVLLAALSPFTVQAAQAVPGYPARPLRLIVPFPPGGTTDILARLIGPKLGEALGQTVVVDNRGGASGLIGAEMIARANPDGHTFGFIISAHTFAPALFAKVAFDPFRDFLPITLVITVPNALSVNPSVPANSIAELVAMAKAQPGKLSFSSAGIGTAVHLTGELFKMAAKVDITHVPYKGGGPALADLMAGQVQMGVQNVSTITQFARAGKIRVLATTGLQRSTALPDVPTVAASGYPGFEAKEWFGLVAPAGTPRAIVELLHREVVRIIGEPQTRAFMIDQGMEISGNQPAEFGAFMKAESVKWSKLIKQLNIRLE